MDVYIIGIWTQVFQIIFELQRCSVMIESDEVPIYNLMKWEILIIYNISYIMFDSQMFLLCNYIIFKEMKNQICSNSPIFVKGEFRMMPKRHQKIPINSFDKKVL